MLVEMFCIESITTQQDRPHTSHKNTHSDTFHRHHHTGGGGGGGGGGERLVKFSDQPGSLVSPTILTSTMASRAA